MIACLALEEKLHARKSLIVGLFATVTVVLEALQVNILSARVVTTEDGYSFDLFQVVDRHGRP